MSDGALSASRTQSSSVKGPVCAMSKPAGQMITAAIRNAAFTVRSDRHLSGLHKTQKLLLAGRSNHSPVTETVKGEPHHPAAINRRHKYLIHQYIRFPAQFTYLAK